MAENKCSGQKKRHPDSKKAAEKLQKVIASELEPEVDPQTN